MLTFRGLRATLLALGLVLATLAVLMPPRAVTGEAVAPDTATKAAQEEEAPETGMSDEAMERWAAATTPNENHAALHYFEGEWTAESRIYYAGPGTEPMVTQGRAHSEMIFGGRFLRTTYEAEMMMPNEEGEVEPFQFHGEQVLGYDNVRNLYTCTWLDNMTTSIFTMRGSRVGRSPMQLDLYGEMDEPMLNVVGRTVRHTIRIVDENRHVMEMYDLHAGAAYKVMEIDYRRITNDDDEAEENGE